MRITPSSTPRIRRAILMASMGAASLLSLSATGAETMPPPAAGGGVNALQANAPVDPQGLSCNDLKEQVRRGGQLTILSGPRGNWGDTFYGPAVPQCPFWQMPQFTYVRTRDSLCGVGFICVDKYPMD